ncbi:phosphoribosylglycinamide formyltransferase [Prochlorococcus marinus str. MIT 9515]|uniref:Phosphoribosylglycinamide formyltransferase n=1 Tax=Prochlorococcus marinus (strain MIT 9515) TaxID=167542 RepID=A2BWL9_PROM5|nr:phosphoribosylglycinamide formyltransferase [Prochlorococcus marinus]ABM72180.1 phosphoribosylglycinamide formyltransferase [Prochlorococcus marinus str. MIT 9515]
MDKSFNYLISPETIKLRGFSPKLKIAILASGEGSNFQELIDLSKSNKFDIDIRILITNKSDAGCISRAKKSNISYKIIKKSDNENNDCFEEEIINTIKNYDVELIVMAGWMKIMSSRFVNVFRSKIINIHPSLLPSFKGNNAIKEAIKHDSKITGCSVHFVEPEVDSGDLIMQAALPILDQDNLETISKKIHFLEHKILPLSISQAGFIVRNSFKGND